jgi:hypothetical protein
VKASLLLANAAETREGLLYILGGGWSLAGPDAFGGCVVVKIEVPWTYLGSDVDWRLELLDADDQPVPHPDNGDPIAAYGRFRPEHAHVPHRPLDVSFVVPFGPLELEPGGRYLWALTVDGLQDDQWRVGFNVRRRPLGPPEAAEGEASSGSDEA